MLRALVLLAVALPAVAAEPEEVFPPLSGRVVDAASILSAAMERDLTARLAAHERATGQQVVVATIADLHGYTIERYGVDLGRYWGIGQSGEDTGAMLLVAPEARRVRIEVGYGLEGQLTDALSSYIINERILPAFRSGDMEGGIRAGVVAMLQVLGGKGDAIAEEARRERDRLPWPAIGFWIFFAVILLFGFGRRGRRGSLASGLLIGGLLGSMGGRRGGFGGGGFGGGGFSGGGGSFGGGGASGGW